MKCIHQTIIWNGPWFCNAWNHFQLVIQLNQSVINLICGPYAGLILCISRIKWSNSNRFIVAENSLLFVFCPSLWFSVLIYTFPLCSYFPVCLTVCLSVCLSVRLPVCLIVWLSVCLAVYRSTSVFSVDVCQTINLGPFRRLLLDLLKTNGLKS